MPKVVIPLTDTKIKALKAKTKSYTESDGQGLQLLIKTNGTKLWEFRYSSPINKKRRKTSFGTYPTTTLKNARDKATNYSQLVSEGIDPQDKKKLDEKIIKNQDNKEKNTFYNVSQEWLKSYENQVSENYHCKIRRALELYTYQYIGSKPITDITRLDLIAIIQELKDRDLKETADRTFMLLNKVFMYATMLEKIPHNITADIDKKVIIGKKKKKHYPTFTKEKDIKALLLSIDEYSGDYTTKMALKMLPYVFVRSLNLRHCEWSEIDFETRQWVIPAKKMKTNIEFIFPLPTQVIELLKEVKTFSGEDKFVFPSFREKNRPLSDNTIIAAIRRIGFTKDEFVPHGFRAMFSTIAYENANRENGHSFTGEVIEALLSHKEPNQIKSAYNHATYQEGKRSLAQWYADHLDKIKEGIII